MEVDVADTVGEQLVRVPVDDGDVVVRLQPTSQVFTARGILDSIEQSGIAFDDLAAQWASDYRMHAPPLLEWLTYARNSTQTTALEA